VALALLARREHGAAELRAKLARKGAASAAIEDALDALQARGLQSDARFAESFVQARYQRGDGPLKIEAALRARGLGEAGIRPWLDGAGLDWNAAARAARRKRFGAAPPADPAGRAQQMRFLQQRGFTPAHIRAAFAAE
jgi:regulatory protein